jgi:hypothetical protein
VGLVFDDPVCPFGRGGDRVAILQISQLSIEATDIERSAKVIYRGFAKQSGSIRQIGNGISRVTAGDGATTMLSQI